MRAPYRKPGIYSQMKQDPLVTADKLEELKRKLVRLKNSQPQAASEVSRLAELGDFSENTEYQMAKWRLRGINSGILNVQKQIDNAVLIENTGDNDKVQIGNTVTVSTSGKTKIFKILGSMETDPSGGVISHNSPVGQALMNKHVGDDARLKMAEKEIVYKIIKIE
ncbi:MAG: transcription elongation factor GreA [uncultured bacterium]|nr:MAG: transcription elongation factor GreA [uncultured bacterium]